MSWTVLNVTMKILHIWIIIVQAHSQKIPLGVLLSEMWNFPYCGHSANHSPGALDELILVHSPHSWGLVNPSIDQLQSITLHKSWLHLAAEDSKYYKARNFWGLQIFVAFSFHLANHENLFSSIYQCIWYSN